MIDISAIISGALNEIDGVTVYYFSPSVWTALPAVSYFEAENAEHERAGGQEFLSEILYQVEAWTESLSGNTSVTLDIDAKLSALGMKRESCKYDVDNEHNLHHRTMQYGCIANQDGQIFQKNNNKKEN